MATSTEQINTLIESYTDLKAFFEGARGDISADRAEQIATVNAFIENGKAKLTRGYILPFDSTVTFSKTSLALASDPNDATQTIWGEIDTTPSGVTTSRRGNGFGVLSYTRASNSAPGASENPQYSTDTSLSKVQFIVGGGAMTNQQINDTIAAEGFELGAYGIGNAWGVSVPVHVLPSVPGVSNNAKLYARFVNEVASNAPSGSQAQDIQNFGGNIVFGLHHVVQYDN